ncbi:ABC transporter permease [Tropicimonas sp. IMCC34043]|uniref:ABC transporter permease n=1 Tax=Tropicimonas sp. IMCC34043 TaxID=2248760 RepID=UPI001E5F5B9E|nr:ABC transporter permease [Tropicimonas sp. IMCC34043]
MQANPTQTESGGGFRRYFNRDAIMQYGVVWAFCVLILLGAIAYPGLFALRNIQNILSQSAPLGIVAVAMTFVLISRGFDLSVASVFALGAVIFANRADPFGLWGAALTVLAVTFVCGVINGLIITKLDVNPFVATLGTGSVFGGGAFLYSRSAPQVPDNFDFTILGTGRWLGWPISIWIMVAIFLVGGFVLSRTVYGRSLFSLGGNEEAARLSGIPVDLIRGSTYVLTGVCAGIGGMILASRLGVGQADMGGSLALDAIAVVVIGGTSLLGGEGAIWRTAIGLLIIATLTNVFDSLAINTNVQQVVKGIIVIAAVALDIYARRVRK